MSFFNRTALFWTIAAGAAALSPAGMAENGKTGEGIKEELRVIERDAGARVPQTFGSSPIRGWYAPDSRTVIIETVRGDYKGTFMNDCSGIRYAESIGFDSSGGMALDKFTTVVLPDGQRCFFKDLTAYTGEEQAG